MSVRHQRGECEALRLLRAIVEGNDAAMFLAIADAQKFLKSLRRSKGQLQMGRKLSRVTPEQLREISRLDSLRTKTQGEIAKDVGVPRPLVSHHLKPSKAMLSALLDIAA